MTAAKIEQLRLDVEELTKFSEEATRQKVKDILLLDARKIETEISALKEKLAKEETEAKKDVAAAPIVQSNVKCYDVRITSYCWDQTSKFVKVIVRLSGVEKLPKENITCDFTNRSMELHVKALDNKNYHLPILHLNKNIDPERSEFKVKTGNIYINLAKATSDNWSDVVASENSSKFKSPNLDPADDPSQSLMSMLKQMYEDGDDDMKRTIAKAWSSKGSDNLDSL